MLHVRMVIYNEPFLRVWTWERVNCFVFVAGEQRRRRRIWCGRRWCRASRGLLRSITQPLSASAPGSAFSLTLPDCLPAAWCWHWRPAPSCLPTLPRTLHLLAYGRDKSAVCLSLVYILKEKPLREQNFTVDCNLFSVISLYLCFYHFLDCRYVLKTSKLWSEIYGIM